MADNDLLSQSEIDALMQGIGSEASAEEAPADSESSGPKEKSIKNYDFKRPDRFSKDQLRMIEMMHESFARNFGTTLSTFIRSICEVKIISVKQSTYADYVSHIVTPSAISVFSVEPLKGNCLLEVTPGIIFTLIDRILGGPGNPMAKERELTNIEQVVVGKIASKALDSFRETWQRIASVRPEIRAKETNPQFVQLVAPSEMVLVLRFEIVFKEVKGAMSICLPYIVLEPVVKKLSTQSWFTSGSKGNDQETHDHIEQRLKLTHVPVIVKVGGTRMTARQLLRVKVGDVIRLDNEVNDEMEVFVENRHKFGCRAGNRGRHKAILITGVVADEEEMPAAENAAH
jgi:flagellar motor switch protein FliM